MKSFFKRQIIKIGHPIFKIYWFIFRPKRAGAKCLIVSNDQILLIRHSYSSSWWSLPGGRVEKGEDFEETARREVFEEVGLHIAPTFLTAVYTEREYKKDTIHVFVADSNTQEVTIDEVEIIEARWFSPDNLPENLGWLAQQALETYGKNIS